MDSESSGAMTSCKTGASEAHLKKMLPSALQEDGFCGKLNQVALPCSVQSTLRPQCLLWVLVGSVAPPQTQAPLLEAPDSCH